jgi:hypothetical protein
MNPLCTSTSHILITDLLSPTLQVLFTLESFSLLWVGERSGSFYDFQNLTYILAIDHYNYTLFGTVSRE